MTYVSQIIMLYTLNLYNVVCQLYLNKNGGEGEREGGKEQLNSSTSVFLG